MNLRMIIVSNILLFSEVISLFLKQFPVYAEITELGRD